MDYALHDYDRYIVCFSGGKDSTAIFLYLLEHGIPRSRIELWHQDIDGCEDNLFDWPITRDYCRRFAAAFGVPLYLQWKVGVFRQELLRTNTAPYDSNAPTEVTAVAEAYGTSAIPGCDSRNCRHPSRPAGAAPISKSTSAPQQSPTRNGCSTAEHLFFRASAARNPRNGPVMPFGNRAGAICGMVSATAGT